MGKEDENKNTVLHFATLNGNSKIVKLLLNAFSGENKENLNGFVMSENLNKFVMKEKLIKFVMKENECKCTALHYASQDGNKQIVISFLKLFVEEDVQRLIGFLLKEDEYKNTAMDLASINEHQDIVETYDEIFNVWNAFCDEENKKLNEKEKEYEKVITKNGSILFK